MHIDRHHCTNGGGEDCGMWIYLYNVDVQNAAHIKLMRFMIAGMVVVVIVALVLIIRFNR